MLARLAAIDMNLLVVLAALLEHHSIRGAAARLSLSPSATSHALRRLRELLGDDILVRAGRRMVPTARAERMRAPLDRLLADVQLVLHEEAAVEPARLRRDFPIAATDYSDMMVLRPLSDALAARAPGVGLHSRSANLGIVQMLRSGAVQLGIGVVAEAPADIRCEVLFRERFVCLLRKGHPALQRGGHPALQRGGHPALQRGGHSAPKRKGHSAQRHKGHSAQRRKLTLKRYAELQHVLVTPGGTPRGVVDDILAQHGLQRRVARTVASFMVAPQLVARSDYVLTVAERIAQIAAETLELAICRPPIELPGFDIQMAWHRRHDADPAHAWLREQLRGMGWRGAQTA